MEIQLLFKIEHVKGCDVCVGGGGGGWGGNHSSEKKVLLKVWNLDDKMIPNNLRELMEKNNYEYCV